MFETRTSRETTTITALSVLVVFDAVTFLLAAASHLGEPIPLGIATLEEPRIIPATIVEGLCGLFFVVAGYALFTRRAWAWQATLAAHVFSIAGVLLGIGALTLGGGPRTELNDIYHLVMLVLLGAGTLLLLTPDAKATLGDDERGSRHQ